jgi:hypothetical protein
MRNGLEAFRDAALSTMVLAEKRRGCRQISSSDKDIEMERSWQNCPDLHADALRSP